MTRFSGGAFAAWLMVAGPLLVGWPVPSMAGGVEPRSEPASESGSSIPAKTVSLSAGALERVCLPIGSDLEKAIADQRTRLVLVLSSYEPPKSGGGLTVFRLSEDGEPGRRLTTIGVFPGRAFGADAPAQRFFLPADAVFGARADAPHCLLVGLAPDAPASDGGLAIVSLETVTLE